MASILDIFSGGVSSVAGGISNVFKGLIEEFHIPPDKALAAQQQATDAANNFILEKAKLAQAAADSELNAKQTEIDAANKNIEDARQANVQLQLSNQSNKWAKITPYGIAIFVSLIWGLVTFYIVARVLHLIGGANAPDLTAVLGIYAGISTLFGTILNFFFGSSTSSKSKDDTIANLSKP